MPVSAPQLELPPARPHEVADPALRSAPPEFHLLTLCLRWPLATETLAAIRNLVAATPPDWDRLLRIAARHRVAGLLARALQTAGITVPEPVGSRLQALTLESAKAGLQLAFAAVGLATALHRAGVPTLFLKGVALTQLLYGDPGLRHAKDIDLLVPREALDRASAELERLGFRPRLDRTRVSPERYAHWLEQAHSMEWRHPLSGVEVELHWQLSDLPTLLRLDLAPNANDAPQQTVRLAGGELATLAPEPLFAYLCVHGASHAWSRLKWLADVYALLAPLSVAQRIRLFRSAERVGAGRPAGQALLLACDLLQLDLGALEAELRQDRILRRLEHAAVRTMLAGDAEREVYDIPFGTSRVYASRLLLGQGTKFRLAALRQLASPPDQLAASPLPVSLWPLFPAVRLLRWFWARLRHGGRSRAQALPW